MLSSVQYAKQMDAVQDPGLEAELPAGGGEQRLEGLTQQQQQQQGGCIPPSATAAVTMIKHCALLPGSPGRSSCSG